MLALESLSDWFQNSRFCELDRQKALIYREVYKGANTSRKALADDLQIRRTTVSGLLQELIDDNLVREVGTRDNSGRGRPEVLTEIDPNRFLVLSVYVENLYIKGSLVNLRDEVIAEETAPVPSTADADLFLERLGNVIDILQKRPDSRSEVLGAGVALIGTVDSATNTWVSSERWPHIKNLNFDSFAKRYHFPVRVRRVLDALLEYAIRINPAYRKENVVLFHWGYGIGASYAHAGSVLTSHYGRFGDIGHVDVDRESTRICHCGSRGCLETQAALWVLLPQLSLHYFGNPNASPDSIPIKDDLDLLDVQSIRVALRSIQSALTILQKLYAPDRFILVGPFAENPAVCAALGDHIRYAARADSFMSVEVDVLNDGFRGCVFGSSDTFFFDRLKTELIAQNR